MPSLRIRSDGTVSELSSGTPSVSSRIEPSETIAEIYYVRSRAVRARSVQVLDLAGTRRERGCSHDGEDVGVPPQAADHAAAVLLEFGQEHVLHALVVHVSEPRVHVEAQLALAA
jgi:hypothetical protein